MTKVVSQLRKYVGDTVVQDFGPTSFFQLIEGLLIFFFIIIIKIMKMHETFECDKVVTLENMLVTQ